MKTKTRTAPTPEPDSVTLVDRRDKHIKHPNESASYASAWQDDERTQTKTTVNLVDPRILKEICLTILKTYHTH